MRHLLRFDRTIPTVDFYFRGPLRALIDEWPQPFRRRPIQRSGPHAFICADRAVIIRYATPRELKLIRALRPRHVHYVVDDDFFKLQTAEELPADYRRRLGQFARTTLTEITELSDTIVAPNPLLFDGFPAKRHRLLAPAQLVGSGDFRHFSQLSGDIGPGSLARSPDRDEPACCHIVFPGTRSHLADLDMISGVLKDLIAANPNLHLTTFMGANAPEVLRNHERISHRRALSWRGFQKLQARENYHIALVAMASTDFNRARSISKVFDVAAFGAAGIYSAGSPPAAVITDGENGRVIDNDPGSWRLAIQELIDSPERALQLALAGADNAQQLGDPQRVRQFWLKELGLFD